MGEGTACVFQDTGKQGQADFYDMEEMRQTALEAEFRFPVTPTSHGSGFVSHF